MNPRTLLSAEKAQTLDLATAAQTSAAGIVSRTVLQTPELRIVLFAFAEGQELTGHSSKRRALVQILSGECEFQFNGTWQRLAAGALLHMPPDHPHAVRAAQGAFSMLLTLGADVPAAPAAPATN
jgi:quercetin dioxygenase-like cupin family protein